MYPRTHCRAAVSLTFPQHLATFAQFDDATSTLKTASRIFEPPVRAPRNRTLQAFRITLDVAQVQGPNALDAVEVWGDDATGLPIEDYGDTCDHQTDFNCHYKCTAADLVTDARIGAAETVLTDVVDWLSASLTLSSADAGPYKPGELEEDEGEYVCDDVPLPQELARTGIFTHGLLIVPTLRPDMTPVRAYPCRPVQRAFSPSDAPARPTVIRVNMVPSFAEAALAEDAQARGLRLRRAAADAVLHEVYKALGWGWDRTSIDARDDILRTKHGESAVESRSSDTCRDFTDCSEEWDLRFIIMNRSPAIVREARAHFGDTSMEFVEMENNLGDGLQSQPPECVTGTDDTEQPSDFNFLPEVPDRARETGPRT